MSAHTPGPWQTRKRADGDAEIENNEGSVLASVYGDDNDPNCWPVSANARLIAAAPDLLGAALQALWHIGTDADRIAMRSSEKWLTSTEGAANLLRAAIAKAEGR